MSDEPKQPKVAGRSRVNVVEIIDDPAEIERLNSLPGANFDDGGAAMMFGAVDTWLTQRPGRSLVKAMLHLIAYLTPEQQVEFAQRLTEKLSNEARARLAEACRTSKAS